MLVEELDCVTIVPKKIKMKKMSSFNDLRTYSRNWIKEFISVYKSEECLWQTRHPEYNNHYIRNQAYDKLVEKLKEVESHPDRAMVVRKVNSLRSAFRREYRKKCDNTNYAPKLWYYDMLVFIADQSSSSKKITNGRRPNNTQVCAALKIDPISGTDDEIGTDDNNEVEHDESMIDESDLLIKRADTKPAGYGVQLIKVHSVGNANDQELQQAVTTIEQSPHSYQQSAQHHDQNQGPMHSIQSIQLSKEQLHAFLNANPPLAMTNTALPTTPTSSNQGIFNNSRNNDEFDAIGVNVASKLRSMNSTQRIIAEKLISDVLFNGQLETLSVSSKITPD